MIDEITKQHTDAAVNQIKDSINYHFEQLVVKPQNEISRLPESIFIETFLPFFCGEKSFEDEQQFLVKWIAIAGNPSKEVHIVDDGFEVLFTVPAIMDTTCIDFKNDRKGQSLANIIANYELHRNQLPVVGKKYLEGTIDKRLETLNKKSDIVATNEQRWREIFIRYKKIEDTQSSEDISTRLSDDEIMYD